MKLIGYTQAMNGNLRMIYASFTVRALAFVLDWLILYALMWFLYFLSAVPFWPWVYMLLIVAYFGGFIGSPLQATPAKLLFGLKVLRHDGGQVGFIRGILRSCCYVFSCLPGIPMGFLMASWTQKHQGLHDFFVDTVVINKIK